MFRASGLQGLGRRVLPLSAAARRALAEYAEYVTTVEDLGKKGGEYGLKAKGFLRKLGRRCKAAQGDAVPLTMTPNTSC